MCIKKEREYKFPLLLFIIVIHIHYGHWIEIALYEEIYMILIWSGALAMFLVNYFIYHLRGDEQ